MKILVVGGTGTIGSSLCGHLAGKHEVIAAGKVSGKIQVDMRNIESVDNMFKVIGRVDSVVCIAGEAKWGPFHTLTEEDFLVGLKSKLMGQVNIVRTGIKYITPGGSITLTTGVLADDPVELTTSAAMVNGAIHSFVKAAALELGGNIRINVVSPELVEDSVERYGDYFPGHTPVPMSKVINGYLRSIFGRRTGEIITVYS